MVSSIGEDMEICPRRDEDESYRITFGNHLFGKIADDLKNKEPLGSKYAIITDSNVLPLYAHSLFCALRDQDLSAAIFFFQAGEQQKTMDTCMHIMGDMSENGFGRDSAILALGGGVVGDMAGFMAAIYMRGIPYIQIPTTVLAQADSSVGGKTAVDTPYGKNLVGAFKQPKHVYIDVATLETLSAREYSMGLAETIKQGVISDRGFFDYLSTSVDEILRRSPSVSESIARKNCWIKGTVVELDPHEKGLRRTLNYGHTAGHAIEKLSDYTLLHGEAVAMGMMVAGWVSNLMGYFPQEDLEAQEDLLQRVGLKTKIPSAITNEEIMRVTVLDKKAAEGKARYALPLRIGEMLEFDRKYVTPVDNEIVVEALNRCR